jgi:hypothetical protein
MICDLALRTSGVVHGGPSVSSLAAQLQSVQLDVEREEVTLAANDGVAGWRAPEVALRPIW